MEQLLLDLPPVVPDEQAHVQAQIAAAAKYCTQFEAIDGNEHMMVLDKAGNILFTAQGIRNQVAVPDDKMLLFAAKGAYLIHNHPSDNTLSLPDLMMATMTGVEVWAVNKLGDSYYSKGFNRRENSDLDLYQMIENSLMRRFEVLILRDYATTDEGNFVLGHAINLVMRNQGLLDYKFNLTAKSQATFDKFAPFFNRVAGYDIQAGKQK